MTTITIDRSLLEQALDVLITRGAQPGYETERAWLKIVKSLEAALSAPATALEQHRPFVPWSKEVEMVASWAATALEAELAATETVITEYRQQCLDNATEIARLRSESEERLQNCAALVAENERLRAAPATAPEPVAWLAHYVGRSGMEQEYVSTDKTLADENDASGKALPLYLHPPATAPAQPERKHTEAEVQALLDAGEKLATMRYSDGEFEQYVRRILGVPKP